MEKGLRVEGVVWAEVAGGRDLVLLRGGVWLDAGVWGRKLRT